MYEDMSAQADKLLQPDGSIITRSGEVVENADEKRAKQYKEMSVQADKLLQPDGSIVTRNGKVVKTADESGAGVYNNMSAQADKLLQSNGSITTRNISNTTNNSNKYEWKPNPSWWDIEEIVKNDTDERTQRYICLITDNDIKTSLNVSSATGFKTSDGAVYTGNNLNHTWDTTQDKDCENTYKTRWIIVYFDNSNANMKTTNFPAETLYVIIDNCKFNSSSFARRYLLQSFKLLNGADLHDSIKSTMQIFINCYSLKSVPSMDTSRVTDFLGMFNACSVLETIESLDTSSATRMNGTFSGCASLEEVPDMNTSNVTDMSSMFAGCYSLKSIPNLNTQKVTDMNNMFYGTKLTSIPKLGMPEVTNIQNMFGTANSIQVIEELDMSNVTSASNMFAGLYSLIYARIKNAKVSFGFDSSNLLTRESLLYIIENLQDLTGKTAQTFTIGTTNKAKLTADEIAVATNKNWIIV